MSCVILSKIPFLTLSVTFWRTLREHKVNGEIFAQLDEEYLRELAPLLGDRVRLKKIISAAFEPASVTQIPESTPVTSPPTKYSPTPSVHSSHTYEVMLL